MKGNPVSFCVLILLLWSCSNVNQGQNLNENPDTVIVSEVVIEESFQEEEENINDEDHGDPGLGAYLIHSEELDPKLMDFMTRFTQDSLMERISASRPFLIRDSDSTLTLGTTLEQLISIDPLRQYLRSPITLPVNWYRAVPPKCIIIQNFPDGVYVSDVNFQNNPITGATEETATFVEKLNRSRGYELILKFSYENGDQTYLDLILFEELGQLELGMVDFGVCEE